MKDILLKDILENRNRTFPISIGLLLFDGVEVLDFCGPFEVFSVTKLSSTTQSGPNRDGEKAFQITCLGEKPCISATNGLSVNVDKLISEAPPFDILILPGGQGTRREIHNEKLIEWVKERANSTPLVLSVCTGALLLAKAGLLDGLKVTTHQGALTLLSELAPKSIIQGQERYIDNGKFILSAGISAGIDMSFHVVKKLLGPDTARATARHMEYDWNEA